MSTSQDMPLGDREAAEIAALADGSLPPERRAALERRIAASPQLRVALDEQMRAIQAVRSVDVGVPARLRAAVQAMRERRRRSRLIPAPVAIGLGAGATTVALAAILALPGSDPDRPTIASAAGLALRAPSAPVPQRPPKGATTIPALNMDGVSYPNWYPDNGWEAVGVRSDRLNGRRATTVFYDKKGRRVGYTVVSGGRLMAPRGATTTVHNGVTLRTFLLAGRPVVTWERSGHTCVLAGAAESRVLRYLAAWKGK
jgi:anti-sigma factor RsiW